jgi:hypothetical protein
VLRVHYGTTKPAILPNYSGNFSEKKGTKDVLKFCNYYYLELKESCSCQNMECQIPIQSAHVVDCVSTCAEQRMKCGRLRRAKWVQSVCLLQCMAEHFKKILHFTDVSVTTLAFQKCWIYYRKSVILHYLGGCWINGGFIYY